VRTVLVIGPDPALAAAIGAALDGKRYRVIGQATLQDEELRLTAAVVDACVLDVDLTSVEPLRLIERVRRALPQRPVILYASDSQSSWEEDAYLLGVNYILTKPVRAGLLNSLLDRLITVGAPSEPRLPAAVAGPVPETRPAHDAPRLSTRTLETLRSYSAILSHTLDAESMLREFLLLLREIIGVNRAAIFLRKPASLQNEGSAGATQRLYSACAIGLAQGLLEHLELSIETGIGGYLFRSGRLLRRDNAEVIGDAQMRREFELLGAQVAVPILDRETLVGLMVCDGRVTGEPVSNEELALIFHLLEPLGLAVKNIWLHDKVAAGHEMMFDILRQIASGCVVVRSDLKVLHANDMARRCFPRAHRTADDFEFNDLPQAIGSKVMEVFKTGKPVADFHYQPVSAPGQHYKITVTPFRRDHAAAPTAALLVVEDCGPADRIRHLEIETANLRLVQHMAERLAHEIGNAVVPISTHQQLFKDRIADPEFQQSLAGAMDEGVRRVSRLVDQMRFLARDRVGRTESVPVKQLIEEAFREARSYHPSSTVLLQFESAGEAISVSGDRQGLQHAFAEIILNALQANTQSCQVQVRARAETDASGDRWAQIEVQDSGAGFSAEAAGKASEPFYTTRNVGLGLGLAVTHKIIQTHRGKLEIPAPRLGSPGLVRISLPLGAIN
jgi:nitrogen-specific signal transduction histidine kinase/DNA-binding NarL/FixJ family response regulator